MRPVFLLIAAALAAAQSPPDPREIVRRASRIDQANQKAALNYAFTEFVEDKKLDGDGRVKESESRKYEIIFLYEEPFRRLIERNGRPVEGKEKQKEEERYNKEAAKRARESESARRKRAAERQKDEEQARKFLKEVPEAYDFTLLGEEVRGGRPCWVISATPRAGYKPYDLRTRILPKMRGTIWIDQEQYQWVRAEAETLDTISFGLVLARLSKGATMEFETLRINDEVWLPKTVHARIVGRLALLKSIRQDVTIRYSDYRKFQTETRMTVGDEAPSPPR
jgi:hypothetical protein